MNAEKNRDERSERVRPRAHAGTSADEEPPEPKTVAVRPRAHAGTSASLSLLLPLTFALFLLVAVLFFRDRIHSFLFHEVTGGGSQSTLTAIREVDRLETLAYVRRSVFPHDYLSDDLEMIDLVRRIGKSGKRPTEVLSARELRHYRAANVSAELGLATRREQNRYVVVTTIYRFGYNAETIVTHLLRNPIPDDLSGAERQRAVERVVASLPPAVLLSVGTEDLAEETYPYGPVPLDADGWRRVSRFVSQVDPDDETMSAMRDEATDRARELLQALLVP